MGKKFPGPFSKLILTGLAYTIPKSFLATGRDAVKARGAIMSDSFLKNEEFVVFWSQPKLWFFAIGCWLFSSIVLLLPSLFLIWLASADELNSKSFLFPAGVLLFSFALLVWLPLGLLKRRHEPLAVLDRTGFTGFGNRFRPKYENWQSDTEIFYYRGVILFNPDSFQNKASELFWGHNNSVRVSHSLAKQGRREIEAAIKRLNPYI